MIEAKKQKLKLVALIGLFASVMIFCPAIYLDLEDFMGDECLLGISGLQVCFGWELLETEIFEFSFMIFVTYSLPIVGSICIYYARQEGDEEYERIAFRCFWAGVICMFLIPSFLEFASKTSKKEVEDYITLGAGAIIGIIACALSALCLLSDMATSQIK